MVHGACRETSLTVLLLKPNRLAAVDFSLLALALRPLLVWIGLLLVCSTQLLLRKGLLVNVLNGSVLGRFKQIAVAMVVGTSNSTPLLLEQFRVQPTLANVRTHVHVCAHLVLVDTLAADLS